MHDPSSDNPYAAPRADSALPDARPLGRLYLTVNLLYGAVVVFGTLVIAPDFTPDRWSVMAALYFWAPVLTFMALCVAPRHRAAVVAGAHAAFVAWLVYWGVSVRMSGNRDVGIGVLIIGLNAAAALAAWLQARRIAPSAALA